MIKSLAHPKELKQYGGYYQHIHVVDDIYTPGIEGGDLWNVIKDYFKINLRAKTILDLGCNAGLYSINSVREDAIRVVGIEGDPYFYSQAEFIKSCLPFDQDKRITYMNKHITPELLRSLGKFDIIFAMNIMHHIEEKYQQIVAKIFGEMTDTLLARYRDKKSLTRDKIHLTIMKAGFNSVSSYPEGNYRFIHYVHKK